MIYLKNFTLPRSEYEYGLFTEPMMTVFNTYYPFGIFEGREIPTFNFSDITIFYGGNGSGKTTILNVIAQAISAKRETLYNRSSFFDKFVGYCDFNWDYGCSFQDAEVITSDDIFNYALDIRKMNEGIDERRYELSEEYLDAKYSNVQLNSLKDYEDLKKMNNARRKTMSSHVRDNLMKNIPEKSNGETALMYFTEKIDSNKIYILDEPENSMAVGFQMELVKFLEDSARFFNCQFIIATHSPFLLASKMAEIYDLEQTIVRKKSWSQLENMRTYYDFFMEHRGDFE